jgi:hypothetical protein
MGWRATFMQQLVFRRAALKDIHGFLDLPLGWSTDDALLIAMARSRPIRRIHRAPVYWRISRANISPNRSLLTRRRKIVAICLFLRWLQSELERPRSQLFENDAIAFSIAMDRCLMEQVFIEGALASLANWRLLQTTRQRIAGRSGAALFKHIVLAALNDSLSLLGRAARYASAARPSPAAP